VPTSAISKIIISGGLCSSAIWILDIGFEYKCQLAGGKASTVVVGVQRRGTRNKTRKEDRRPVGLLCMDVHQLLTQSPTPKERRFVTSHEDVFRYSSRDA
jgi:hypothetical protein